MPSVSCLCCLNAVLFRRSGVCTSAGAMAARMDHRGRARATAAHEPLGWARSNALTTTAGRVRCALG